MEEQKRILVVCTGNTCRSAMAAPLIRNRLARENLADQIKVDSAGTSARRGEPASQYAIELLAELDILLSAHRSRQVQLDDLVQADLVLVMTTSQRNALEKIAPAQRHKVLLFSELESLSSGDADISDPFGESKAVYRATLTQLNHILERGWATLLSHVAQ